jgi:hypothetical protein
MFDRLHVAGVYVVQHATTPMTIYVGESEDCMRRNRQLHHLGLEWGIVCEMPGSTVTDRQMVEAKTAISWEARGYRLLSWYKGRRKRPARRRTWLRSLRSLRALRS